MPVPDKQERRDFIKKSAGLAGVAVMPQIPVSTDDPEWRNRQPGMAYRRLGRTNYMVSEIVCGGNTIDPGHNRHVALAVEMGLNYFDTSPHYGGFEGVRGGSERGFGALLQGSANREKIFVNTKVSALDRNRGRRMTEIYDAMTHTQQQEFDKAVEKRIRDGNVTDLDYMVYYKGGGFQMHELRQSYLGDELEKWFPDQINRRQLYYDTIITSVEESLQRIGTDYLDLLTCPHGANSPNEIQMPEIFEAFERLHKAGKVRHLSCSAHSDPAGILLAAAQTGQFSAMMPAFNYINAHYFTEALAAAKKADMGIIAMKVARAFDVLSYGSTSPMSFKYQELHKEIPGDMKTPMKAYLWVLQQPGITAVNSDMLSEGHVRENLSLAGRKVVLQNQKPGR